MEKSAIVVLRTIIYYDLFDYPLTLIELFKWLKVESPGQPAMVSDLTELQNILEELKDKVEAKNGFYFLTGREGIIKTRLERYNITEQKFKRAKKYAKLLRLMPYVKCVLISNRLGYGNVHESSDIDLAVIVQNNRLWLCRLLTVGLLDLLKVRPKQISRPQAIDLNFFISQENLNLESLIFDEEFVFPYWLNQLMAVYDQGAWQDFVEQNNWLVKYLPNYFAYDLIDRRQVKDNWLVKSVRFKIKLLTNFNFLEKWAENYQRRLMPEELKKMINQDSRVIINQKMLKFHQSENWKKLRVQLNQRWSEFNLI
jgi:hypothetical protein